MVLWFPENKKKSPFLEVDYISTHLWAVGMHIYFTITFPVPQTLTTVVYPLKMAGSAQFLT